MDRFANFQRGIFDIAAIIYYVSLVAIFLFLTVRVYEKRRWE
jgi:ABC-2 type transport system permease protein